MDTNPGTEEGKEQEDQESNFFVKKQNEELKKANKELWKRVEDVQKENAELKRKIDQSLSLSGNKYLDSILRNISLLILQVRISRSKLRARQDLLPLMRTTSSERI